MCLYTNNKKPLIAKKDITCYKIVFNSDNKNLSKHEVISDYVTVCQTFPINENQGLIFPEEKHVDSMYNGYYEIGIGFLHSYISLHEAKNSMFSYDVILECTIPKGSKYYIDKDGKEYASDRLIIRSGIHVRR